MAGRPSVGERGREKQFLAVSINIISRLKRCRLRIPCTPQNVARKASAQPYATLRGICPWNCTVSAWINRKMVGISNWNVAQATYCVSPMFVFSVDTPPTLNNRCTPVLDRECKGCVHITSTSTVLHVESVGGYWNTLLHLFILYI